MKNENLQVVEIELLVAVDLDHDQYYISNIMVREDRTSIVDIVIGSLLDLAHGSASQGCCESMIDLSQW